jgi:hypothetical protein
MDKRIQKKLVVPAKSLPSNALIGGGDPAAFVQKTLDSRFRGNDELGDTGFPLKPALECLNRGRE